MTWVNPIGAAVLSGAAPGSGGIITVTEPLTFSATTTAPTKGGTAADAITLRDDGSGFCDVFMNYRQIAPGNGGNGTTLIALPGGRKFDTAFHPINTQVGSMVGAAETVKIIPAMGTVTNAPNGLAHGQFAVVPHSATHFKLMVVANISGGLIPYAYVASNYFTLGDTICFQGNFRFKKG